MFKFREMLKQLYISRVTGGERRHTLAAPLAERCYRCNMKKQAPETGYIFGQGGGAATDEYRYGLAPMSFNGCEVIAVYNALLALGEQGDIREIARRFQIDGAVMAGLFGTDLSALARFFRERGYKVQELDGNDAERYDDTVKSSDAAILSFWWSERSMWLHTVMLRRREARGGLLLYNWSSRYRKGPAVFPDVRSLIQKTGIVPVQLITICRKEQL